MVSKRTSGSDARTPRRLKRAGHTTDWEDVDLECSTSPWFSRLPASLLREQVIDFVAPWPSFDNIKILRDGIDAQQYTKQLVPFRAVSQQWFKLAQVLESECRQRVSQIEVKTGDHVECKKLLRQAKKDGETALQLTISMGSYTYDNGSLATPYEMDQEEITWNDTWWEEFFQCYPHVIRLDLSRLSAKCTGLALAAASRLCPRVHALELQCGSMGLNSRDHANLTTSTTEALRLWHASNGGLRVLTMPHWVIDDALFTAFISTLADCCPHLEYLLHKSIHQSSQSVFEVRTQPNLPIEVFTEFCRRCTKLRELPWIAFPFSPEIARQFSAIPRPLVENIDFEIMSRVRWQDMCDLSSLRSMISNQPSLRSFAFKMYEFRSGVVQFPPSEVDKLALHIAQTCPLLETFDYHHSLYDLKYGLGADAIEALTQSGQLRGIRVLVAFFNAHTLANVLRWMRTDYPRDHFIILRTNKYAHAPLINALVFLEQMPVERLFRTVLEFRSSGRSWNESAHKEAREGNNEDKTTIETACQWLESRKVLVDLVDAIKRKHAKMLSYIRVEAKSFQVDGKTVEGIQSVIVMVNIPKDRLQYFRDDPERKGGVFDVPVSRF